MHEMSMAVNIAELLKEEMEKRPGQTLAKVNLSVGELSGIQIESLKFSLEIVFRDKGWGNVELNVHKAPLMALCKECGGEFEPEPADFRCKNCGSGNIEITGGQSLTIDSIELL